MVFNNALKEKQVYILQLLADFLPENNAVHNELILKAMSYSLFAGGKRIRPLFMLEAYHTCGGADEVIEAFMASIEMIHTYSLIHDDLPAMDNDDLRRGMPTCHIQYGENIAILAGDALLNRAFEIIIDEAVKKQDINIMKAMQELGQAAGVNGMIGGQVADVINENRPMDLELLNYIHLHKTSALIEAAFVIGAILANSSEESIEIFRSIGKNIGLAFQIQDDLLDVLGTEEELGKPLGSDEKNNKVTYVTLLGVEASQKIVEEKLNQAKDALLHFGNCEFLLAFVDYLRIRKN